MANDTIHPMKIRRYQSIKAWQFADDLAVSVYEATKTFPRMELYGMVQQMRRCAVSVAANIAEGANRHSRKEYVQFLSIARGSLAELRYYVHLANRLGYLKQEEHRQLDQQCDEAARVLYGLMRSVAEGSDGAHPDPSPSVSLVADV